MPNNYFDKTKNVENYKFLKNKSISYQLKYNINTGKLITESCTLTGFQPALE